VTEICAELPENVVPMVKRDRTNAERQRRYRERRRNGSAKSGRNGSRNGKRNDARNGRSGDRAQPIGTTSSSAVRYAAQAVGHAAELVEFPASGRVAEVTQEPVTQASSPDIPPDNSRPKVGPRAVAPKSRRTPFADTLAYGVACGLAAVAAWFSLKGLAILFPGAPHEIVVMGTIMECAKLVACGWLAGAWRHVPRFFRGVLMLLIAGLAVINASGTFSQLTAAHVGNRAVSSATLTMQGTNLDSRIEVATARLADVDRRIASIDGIVAGAAQRGRAHAATGARTALIAERERDALALADLKVERGGVQARATIAESEAMPLRYAAELLGMGGDDERASRLLIALMVLCCDPLAIALTAAVSARRSITIWSEAPSIPGVLTQQRSPSLDHLVGAGQQHWWQIEAEHPCGFAH
jgi:hypothetical protein